MKQPDEAALARQREGHRARLRERFLRGGLDSFPPYETVELMLTFLMPRRDMKPLAKHLMERFPTVSALLDAEISELTACGLSDRTAVFIRFLRSIITLYRTEKVSNRPLLQNNDEVVAFLQTKLGGLKKETLHAPYLDAGRRLLGTSEWAGTVNRAAVPPREVVERALLLRASCILLAHNHPSGDCRPSAADLQFTKEILNGLDLFGIRLLDHIIITRNSCLSLLE